MDEASALIKSEYRGWGISFVFAGASSFHCSKSKIDDDFQKPLLYNGKIPKTLSLIENDALTETLHPRYMYTYYVV